MLHSDVVTNIKNVAIATYRFHPDQPLVAVIDVNH